MASSTDPQLLGLTLDRARLLEEYAPLLRRVGASVGKDTRKRLNAQLRVKRLAKKHELHANAEAIAARCMELYGEDK